MSIFPSIQTILVPQGAEYQTVCRGLSQINSPKPLILPIPIGCKSLTQHLEKLPLPKLHENIVLMGLCGSLSPQYEVGDVVIYQECVNESNSTQSCDHELTMLLQNSCEKNRL